MYGLSWLVIVAVLAILKVWATFIPFSTDAFESFPMPRIDLFKVDCLDFVPRVNKDFNVLYIN